VLLSGPRNEVGCTPMSRSPSAPFHPDRPPPPPPRLARHLVNPREGGGRGSDRAAETAAILFVDVTRRTDNDRAAISCGINGSKIQKLEASQFQDETSEGISRQAFPMLLLLGAFSTPTDNGVHSVAALRQRTLAFGAESLIVVALPCKT